VFGSNIFYLRRNFLEQEFDGLSAILNLNACHLDCTGEIS